MENEIQKEKKWFKNIQFEDSRSRLLMKWTKCKAINDLSLSSAQHWEILIYVSYFLTIGVSLVISIIYLVKKDLTDRQLMQHLWKEI